MNQELFLQFTSFLEDKWVKRIKSFTGFVARISKIQDVLVQPQVVKVANASKNIKNFLDVLDDAATFNITKMNPNGLLVKSLNSNATLTTFLTKNAEKLESFFKYVVKFNEYFPNVSSFVKKASKYFKITGISLSVFDFGHKLYKNYKQTKSLPKSFLGSMIDSAKDFNVLDGITYGSFLGPKGAIAGMIVGGTAQIVHFLNPNFFEDVKKWVFEKYDEMFKKKQEPVDNVLQISKEVIYDRIQFYISLIVKIEAMIVVLRRFSNQFEELSSGKTSITIKKEGIEKLIIKCKTLLEEHIKVTLTQLQQFQQEMGAVFHYDQLLNQYDRNVVHVNQQNMDDIRYHLNQSIQCCEYLVKNFQQIAYSELAVEALQKLDKVYQDLEAQKNNVDNLKNTAVFLEGLNFYE